MKMYFYKTMLLFLSIFLIACQDRENRQDSDVDIIPPEDKNEEISEQNRPMSRSYLLAKMRENGELSSFTEELDQSGLEEEFEGKEGLFTIFAPSNAAYDRIPAKEINADGSPKTEESRRDLMRYYMVEGEMTVDYLKERIKASDEGIYEFKTALGEMLWATLEGDKIVITDVLGNKAAIVTSNMEEFYGVYHIIDNVLEPGESNNSKAEDGN